MSMSKEEIVKRLDEIGKMVSSLGDETYRASQAIKAIINKQGRPL